MKVKERRLVYQEWYETDLNKYGWDSHGWYFDNGQKIEESEWEIIEYTEYNKFSNPIVAIVEREIEL